VKKLLQRGIAADTVTGKRELGELIYDLLGDGVTVAEINGARNMLTMILEALPD
jgi:hypothetical protein